MEKSPRQWVVYILECGDGSLYTGITNDLQNRIQAHENGLGAKYTKGRGPLILRYQEDCPNRSVASKRELEVKQFTRLEKLALISNVEVC
ncbi:MAG: GIY-YIG nuclease family protein [Alphaproteobacteria bacterium]|nr:GIY-YIG nuclease family protein [Alphaproteobacteria bacterium]NCQ88524.1 GIY-YIG nuclease family protein [Alphaproteobacteria bacterium]NCT06067.1 GIY-YIG nuclease family protein [Alphaproteobacteria bacterium]